MPRTTVTKVRNVFDTDLSDSELTSWMDVATELVDDVANADPSLSDSRLEKIERLTTAHLASTEDQRISNASRETGSVNYQGQSGMGLNSTTYGQQAKVLDPTGQLAENHFTLSE